MDKSELMTNFLKWNLNACMEAEDLAYPNRPSQIVKRMCPPDPCPLVNGMWETGTDYGGLIRLMPSHQGSGDVRISATVDYKFLSTKKSKKIGAEGSEQIDEQVVAQEVEELDQQEPEEKSLRASAAEDKTAIVESEVVPGSRKSVELPVAEDEEAVVEDKVPDDEGEEPVSLVNEPAPPAIEEEVPLEGEEAPLVTQKPITETQSAKIPTKVPTTVTAKTGIADNRDASKWTVQEKMTRRVDLSTPKGVRPTMPSQLRLPTGFEKYNESDWVVQERIKKVIDVSDGRRDMNMSMGDLTRLRQISQQIHTQTKSSKKVATVLQDALNAVLPPGMEGDDSFKNKLRKVLRDILTSKDFLICVPIVIIICGLWLALGTSLEDIADFFYSMWDYLDANMSEDGIIAMGSIIVLLFVSGISFWVYRKNSCGPAAEVIQSVTDSMAHQMHLSVGGSGVKKPKETFKITYEADLSTQAHMRNLSNYQTGMTGKATTGPSTTRQRTTQGYTGQG